MAQELKNKVIARDYVEGNYIKKAKIEQMLKELEIEYEMYAGREFSKMNTICIKISLLREILGEE